MYTTLKLRLFIIIINTENVSFPRRWTPKFLVAMISINSYADSPSVIHLVPVPLSLDSSSFNVLLVSTSEFLKPKILNQSSQLETRTLVKKLSSN